MTMFIGKMCWCPLNYSDLFYTLRWHTSTLLTGVFCDSLAPFLLLFSEQFVIKVEILSLLYIEQVQTSVFKSHRKTKIFSTKIINF